MANFKRGKRRKDQKQRHGSGMIIATPAQRRLSHVIAGELDGAMEATGLSRSELARRLQVSRGAVTQFLDTDANLTVDSIERITTAIGKKCEFRIK